jgi:hypothetical protein
MFWETFVDDRVFEGEQQAHQAGSFFFPQIQCTADEFLNPNLW